MSEGLLTGVWLSPSRHTTEKPHPSMDDSFHVAAHMAFPLLLTNSLYTLTPAETVRPHVPASGIAYLEGRYKREGRIYQVRECQQT